MSCGVIPEVRGEILESATDIPTATKTEQDGEMKSQWESECRWITPQSLEVVLAPPRNCLPFPKSSALLSTTHLASPCFPGSGLPSRMAGSSPSESLPTSSEAPLHVCPDPRVLPEPQADHSPDRPTVVSLPKCSARNKGPWGKIKVTLHRETHTRHLYAHGHVDTYGHTRTRRQNAHGHAHTQHTFTDTRLVHSPQSP